MALTHGELIFARNLDEKLQKIHGEKDTNLFIHNDLNFKNKNMKMNNARPQFVTTVKKGSFLEPPPEVAALLGLNSLKSSAVSPHSGSSASCVSTVTTSTQQATATVVMYSYASKPKVLNKNYHTDCSRSRLNNARDGTTPYGNLMYDRRVIRGSTYATHSSPTDEIQARQQEVRRRAQARRKARVNSSRGRQGTPPPVPGRKHEPVQTERYLEELLDRPPENDASCQTDLFLERPSSPLYIPSAGGEDKETQIYPGELFDFDAEVTPILENIVTQALEQGLSEVLEEEELLDVQVHQRRLQEVRALEELQQRRLSGSDIDLIKNSREPGADQQDLVPSIADLLPSILTKLQSDGAVLRPQDVDQDWLLDLITARLVSPDVLEDLVREALRCVGRLEDRNSPADRGEADDLLLPTEDELTGEDERQGLSEIKDEGEATSEGSAYAESGDSEGPSNGGK